MNRTIGCYVDHCVMDNIVLGKDIAVVVSDQFYWFAILTIFLVGILLGFSMGFYFRLFLNKRGKKELGA